MPRIDARFVIQNEVKNLLTGNALSTSSHVGLEGMLRFTQHDKQYVILNEVKNPLTGNALSTSSHVGLEGMLRFTQHDSKQHAQDDRVAGSGKSL